MLQEIENKIEECKRQMARARPEQLDKMTETFDKLCEWRDNLRLNNQTSK